MQEPEDQYEFLKTIGDKIEEDQQSKEPPEDPTPSMFAIVLVESLVQAGFAFWTSWLFSSFTGHHPSVALWFIGTTLFVCSLNHMNSKLAGKFVAYQIIAHVILTPLALILALLK